MAKYEPSEKQLAYAAKLGLTVPNGATSRDVGETISVRLGQDRPSSASIRRYADAFGVAYTQHTGEQALMGRISEHLHGEKLAAWFAFWVYRDLVGEKKAKLTHTDEVFAACGEHLTNKNRAGVYDSIRENYGGNILRFGTFTDASGLAQQGASRRTKAYKAAAEYLSEQLGIERRTRRTGGQSKPANRPVESGYLSVVVVLGIGVGGAALLGNIL